MSEITLKIAAGTNAGLIRNNNEDNFVVCPDLAASSWTIPQANESVDLGELGALLVVADGMGGANAGEVASAIAIESVQQQFTPERLQGVAGNDELMQNFMIDAVKQADQSIAERSYKDEATEGMGTTIVIAWIYGMRAYICWCGDSRCYAYRANENKLERLSKDHSYVQELVDQGELDPNLANDHPLSNIITRCLGADNKRAEPEAKIYELHHSDILLLCTDGLSSMSQDDEIASIIYEHINNSIEIKDELITMALSAGGHDNVTVALCRIDTEEQTSLEKESESDETEAPLKDTKPCEPIEEKKGCKWVWIIISLLVVISAGITMWKLLK